MDAGVHQFTLEINLIVLVALVALGLIVGLLSGLFGVGGGFLLTPLLNVLLGVPYNLAVGSTLVQMAAMTWVGTRQHVKLGHVDIKLALSLMAGSFFGAEAGVRLQRALRDLPEIALGAGRLSGFETSMGALFFVVLATIGTVMVVETGRTRRRKAARVAGARDFTEEAAAGDVNLPGNGEPAQSGWSRWLAQLQVWPTVSLSSDASRRISVWIPAGLGFFISILTGLLGTGGGLLHMPALIYVLGVPTVIAVGTASLQTAVVAIYGGARYIMLGDVLWPLVGSLLIGSVAGAKMGAVLSERVPRDLLRRSFAYLLLGTACLVAMDLVRDIVT